jgi:(S)-2-hydroxy-acid oxidase
MSKPIGPVDEQYPTLFGAGPAPVNLAEYERYAKNNLPRNAHDYYASGANDMITLRENRDAYSRLRIMPKILIDVSKIDTKTTILGDAVASPICIAPTAMQQMAHPDGEIATSRASAKTNTLMTLSSWSTIALEDVASAAPTGLRWFQLYVYKDRVVTLDLVKRAERAGYKAFAVTVDTPILGRREADIRNRFALPSHLTMGNFKGKGGSHSSGTKSAGSTGSGLASYVSQLIDQTLTWSDIAWLRKNTTLKIVVKGVMTAQDALIALENGVDGIWISNHGARQLDTVPATIEVLPEIVRAVNGRCEVYLDGGIIRGTDVLKALALGARAVFIGRPVLWGLTHSGEEGVTNVLKLLNDEFALAMKLTGAVNLSELKPSLIRPALSFQAKL